MYIEDFPHNIQSNDKFLFTVPVITCLLFLNEYIFI